MPAMHLNNLTPIAPCIQNFFEPDDLIHSDSLLPMSDEGRSSPKTLTGEKSPQSHCTLPCH